MKKRRAGARYSCPCFKVSLSAAPSLVVKILLSDRERNATATDELPLVPTMVVGGVLVKIGLGSLKGLRDGKVIFLLNATPTRRVKSRNFSHLLGVMRWRYFGAGRAFPWRSPRRRRKTGQNASYSAADWPWTSTTTKKQAASIAKYFRQSASMFIGCKEEK